MGHVSDGEHILIAGALLSAGLLASLLASRLRVPGLVLFLVTLCLNVAALRIVRRYRERYE